MQKYRIEGLSDLVFGLALSIGSLAMINQPVNNVQDVQNGILWFAFGFFVIVSVWVSYTKIISETKVETKMDFRLNLALLMLVAIEPYLLYLLGQDDPDLLDFTSTAYAIDIGLIMLILAGLYGRRGVPGLSQETVNQNRIDRNRYIATASIFLVSAMPFLWIQSALFDVNLRFVIWLCAMAPGLVVRVLYHHPPTKGTD
jgi:uncharacterized membrane protein